MKFNHTTILSSIKSSTVQTKRRKRLSTEEVIEKCKQVQDLGYMYNEELNIIISPKCKIVKAKINNRPAITYKVNGKQCFVYVEDYINYINSQSNVGVWRSKNHRNEFGEPIELILFVREPYIKPVFTYAEYKQAEEIVEAKLGYTKKEANNIIPTPEQIKNREKLRNYNKQNNETITLLQLQLKELEDKMKFMKPKSLKEIANLCE